MKIKKYRMKTRKILKSSISIFTIIFQESFHQLLKAIICPKISEIMNSMESGKKCKNPI
jgi:hypothetical protein